MQSHWELALRLLIAAGLGSVIGAERERLVWAAGLRTHMLVCVGACLVMTVSMFGFSDILGTPNVNLDPSRVAAQVISGIGFLGAGSILLRGEIIRGLTTAASLWAVAGIGLAVGGGLYVEAVAATAIIIGILAGIKPFEEKFQMRRRNFEITLQAEHGQMSLAVLNQLLGGQARHLTRYISHASKDHPGCDEVSLTLRRLSTEDAEAIMQQLQSLSFVRSVGKPTMMF